MMHRGFQTASEQIINQIEDFLKSAVYPIANDLDHDSEQLKRTFNHFKDRRFFGIYIDESYGGYSLTQHEKVKLQVLMGYYGGAFAFLQAMINTAIWIIKQSDNDILKKNYLSQIAKGNLTIGNATSQLKPNSRASVNGVKIKEGYVISGDVSFASGFQYYDKLLIGFYIEQEEYYTIIPFENINSNQGSISIGKILDSFTMKSINTVTLRIKDFYIGSKDIIVKWPKHHFSALYKSFPPYAFTLGIALSALDLISQKETVINNNSLAEKFSSLKRTVNQYINQLEVCSLSSSNQKLFANIMKISMDSVVFAILISGGASLMSVSSIQRLYKELAIWFIPKASAEVSELWGLHDPILTEVS